MAKTSTGNATPVLAHLAVTFAHTCAFVTDHHRHLLDPAGTRHAELESTPAEASPPDPDATAHPGLVEALCPPAKTTGAGRARAERSGPIPAKARWDVVCRSGRRREAGHRTDPAPDRRPDSDTPSWPGGYA